MLSQAASRPRPPGLRRISSQRPSQHDEAQQPDAATPQCVADDASSTPHRSPFSDVLNRIHDPTVKTLDKSLSSSPSTQSQTKTYMPTGQPACDDMIDENEGAPLHTIPSSLSQQDLDPSWLGALERHELEELLIEASRKVREREQKLVVAANIGKALLEKNLSLRSGIMSSMASSSSLFGLADIEAMIEDFADPSDATSSANLEDQGLDDGPAQYPSSRPMYSPPTTDIDIQSQGPFSPARSEPDNTPLAHPVLPGTTGSDYFTQPTSDRSDLPSRSSALDAPYSPIVVSTWVPNESGLVPSQPCSPSASIRSFASQAFLSPVDSVSRAPFKNGRANTRHRSRPSLVQIQALEAQRQLASLGEQNDVLHQQIAELQHEAESARFDGSKRLNRLNKEIRGLKAELEAATKRNIELETSTSSTRPSSRTPLRSPANRESLSQEPKSPLFSLDRRHGAPSAATLLPDSMPAAKDDPVSEQHGLAPSTSTLEDLVRSTQSTNGESALVVQLLAKIKELEETNAVMAKAELDFGNRVGRAMEEDERLRDAFNTVGQDLGKDATFGALGQASGNVDSHPHHSPSKVAALQPGFMTPSGSQRSLASLASSDTSSPVASLSPGQRRRAPGNRHIIEHRKTVRAAIRRAKKELAAEIWNPNGEQPLASGTTLSRSSTEQSLGTYSIDLSGESSAASSPRSRGLHRKSSASSFGLGPAGRPRIRITPSIEDLGRRRKTQERIITGPAHDSSPAEDWQDVITPTLASFPRQDTLRPADAVQSHAHRSADETLEERGRERSPARTSWQASAASSPATDMLAYLSPSRQWSSDPTARVRRSRSRSSSFVSDGRSAHSPSLRLHSPDSYLGSRPRTTQSPASASSQRGRTLGSELGSIFGGDDRKNDFDDDLPQNRRTVVSATQIAGAVAPQSLVLATNKAMPLQLWTPVRRRVESDRPTANVGRLVPENTSEHTDDLECVLAHPAHAHVDDVFLDGSPLRPRDAALLTRVEDGERGEWLAGEPIIEAGGLQDEDEPRGAQFDLISAVVENEAVAWADDDDYGRTISQRDAVKLGLLAPSPSTANVRSLRAIADRSMRGTSIFTSTKASHKGKAKQSGGTRGAVPFRLEIESSEQVEDRLRLESLLRRRRLDLLRERGFSDGRTPDEYDRKQEDQLVAMYAPTPRRMHEKRRRALEGDPSRSQLALSPQSRESSHSMRQWLRDVSSVSPSVRDDEDRRDAGNLDLDCIGPEDGEFELLDCPSWKKQGGRGTDYFPTSFRARYRPAMVKQRAAHVSQVTYAWVEEWVQFAFVVFLAFVVMVEQGPNRAMHRAKAQAKGGAVQALMPKAE
ncbi:uncharacterized protein PAN0_010d4159 [Moesziomyces antarcticus]|uniref:Uncharacterized protein n=2 Tax=Pseudozyma antarctica TaxID=84753 RepID=A0A081CGZ1_PSEA2|nr:uncharacterized protein PAN0_010d4159 [Moesziomyces antarcticus]GAK65937.1 conserved hypothetical protein [Moesziomyces antarcticus]SPO45570.1 uncharacterized protein PSANT_03256 [Moesziomyces antarcticus]